MCCQGQKGGRSWPRRQGRNPVRGKRVYEMCFYIGDLETIIFKWDKQI